MLRGDIKEWVEFEPRRFARYVVDPEAGGRVYSEEDGIITLSEGISFADYWQKRIDDDAPERRKVDRRIIIERLEKAGLLDYAEAALLAAPAVVRWRWNTADAVYADDPDTLAFLKAIGADPEAILAP